MTYRGSLNIQGRSRTYKRTEFLLHCCRQTCIVIYYNRTHVYPQIYQMYIVIFFFYSLPHICFSIFQKWKKKNQRNTLFYTKYISTSIKYNYKFNLIKLATIYKYIDYKNANNFIWFCIFLNVNLSIEIFRNFNGKKISMNL